MKGKILAKIIIILLVLSILGWGKEQETQKSKKESSVTIVDSTGRQVDIPKPLKRIVVLNTDAAEIICALSAEDRVVGVVDSVVEEDDFFKRLKGKPSVGRWNSPSFEKIVEVDPEVVIAYSRHPGPELEEKLEPTSIKVVRIDCYKIESLDSDVKALGVMLGKEKEAEEFVNFYRKYLKIIKTRLSSLSPEERVKVYVESYSDYTSVARGSGGHQICTMAGGINIAADEPVPYPKISAEWVLKKNPQIIVKAVTNSKAPSGYGVDEKGPLEKLRTEIMNRPGFSEIDAVKNNRVYLISADIWTGPRAVIGIIQMAKWFYPGHFKDLNPKLIHRRYLERFLGLKYKGTFVYP